MFVDLLSHFITLFVVIDPIGLIPIFLSITHGYSGQVRRRLAIRACLLAGLVLTGFALGGDWLLRQLGITIPAFRIAGGLLLFATAFDMVVGWRSAWQLALLIGVIAIVLILCAVAFLFASRIAKLMGITAGIVLSRLFGVLLAALAVQYVVDGIHAVAAG